MSKITEICAILKVLSEVAKPMRPSDIGDTIGMTALHAGCVP